MIILSADIEAQVQEIQARSKVDISEKDRIGLGESGFFDSEIYGGVQSRFDGYVTSIATNDEVDDEDDGGAIGAGTVTSGRQTFTAPQAILNEVIGEDVDPFAEHRRPTIADREDEYRAKRRKMVISPERVDPFAEGMFKVFSYSCSFLLLWRIYWNLSCHLACRNSDLEYHTDCLLQLYSPFPWACFRPSPTILPLYGCR